MNKPIKPIAIRKYHKPLKPQPIKTQPCNIMRDIQISPMKLLIKFPTRARPDKFKETLELYYALLSNKHQYEFQISMDLNDDTMNNDNMKAYLNSKQNLKYAFGTSTTKVQAINADMENKSFDILLLASDDMIPVVHGYDDIIARNMAKHFPNLNGCLHFNDGRVGRKLNTLVIMGRKLYDDLGYIYHPDYKSLWCDNEFQNVTESLNAATYIDQVIIKHKWIEHTGADKLHKHNESFFNTDKSTFERRRALNFPKGSING